MTIDPATTTALPDPQQLKKTGAAKDFEALMIGQMLKSMHEEQDDQSSDAVMGFGEEQLAKTISQAGGFGLAKVIGSHLP